MPSPKPPPPPLGPVFCYHLLRDYRRRPATPVETIMAMNAAMTWQSRIGWRRIAVARRIADQAQRLPRKILGQWLRHAGAAKRASGRGRARQLVDLWRNATRRGLTPAEYYEDGVYHAAVTGFDELIFAYPFYVEASRRLTAERHPTLRRDVQDKVRFAILGAERGLAVVPTLAQVGPGMAPDLPDREFLVKPRHGAQGQAIEIWRPETGRYVRSHDGLALERTGLQAHLAATAARAGELVIQPRLYNHPAFAALAGHALSTTRTITMIAESGEPEVVDAAFRASTAAGAPVDNFHAGGRMFQLDIRTGRILRGCYMHRDPREPRETYQTDEPRFCGQMHPAWDAVREFARRCHAAFPDLFIAGWDIAMTPDGPVAIEVNIPPGITVARQIASGQYHCGRLITLLAWHAQRWLERNTPAGSRWRPPVSNR